MSRHSLLLQKIRRTFPRELGIEDVEPRSEDFIARPTHGEVGRTLSEILKFVVEDTPMLVFIRAKSTCDQGHAHAAPRARAELQWLLKRPAHDPLRECSGQGSMGDPLIVSLSPSRAERILFDTLRCCLDVRVVRLIPAEILTCIGPNVTRFETATETEVDFYRKLEERQLAQAPQQPLTPKQEEVLRRERTRTLMQAQARALAQGRERALVWKRERAQARAAIEAKASRPETRGRLTEFLDCEIGQRAAAECETLGDISAASVSGSTVVARGRIHSSGPALIEVLGRPVSRSVNRIEGICPECGRSWAYVWHRRYEDAGLLTIDRDRP